MSPVLFIMLKYEYMLAFQSAAI